jgi:isopenicillin N synthase-like dioxygenase
MDLQHGDSGAAAPDLTIPLIDLTGPESDVVARIGGACADWGFFQVVGHDVAPTLSARAIDHARAFFALPAAEKRMLSRTATNPWGYYDRELTKNLRDKKEIFDIGPEPRSDGADSLWTTRTPWPDQGAGFRDCMATYAHACEALSRRLLGLICLGLGVERERLAAAFEPTSTSFLRLNHYPVHDPMADEIRAAAPGGDLGIHHHTDAGALTVLLQDENDGLQVWRDGGWRTISAIPGAFVINIGDMVQVWSNDLYRAPVHRVLAMDRVDRLSLPLFYNPAYEARVAPIETCTAPQAPARYRPIPWGEFRRRRADGDFADYGAEVQISDYRV